VETAVRAIHVPTGITVLASDERTQIQNKKLARERLIIKLSAIEEEKLLQQTHDVWMNHNTLERGNPVKKFKGDL
jgi:peptide chain release factor